MATKRSIALALAGTAFGVAGLIAAALGLIGNDRGKPRADASSKSRGLEPTQKSEPTGHGLSVEEFKKRLAALHPGMDIDEPVEERIDVTKLPLPERKQRLERGIAAHALEPWDSAWGTATEERLTSDFTTVAEQSTFALRKVECRTSTCVVTLQWEDDETGRAAYDTIVSTPIGLGCRLEMLPPQTGAREAPAFFDCTALREASAKAAPMVASVTGAVPTRTTSSGETRPGP
jgi:hypothetical protein